jgi:hypothetical protein
MRKNKSNMYTVQGYKQNKMVGPTGFEPATPTVPKPQGGALPGCATVRLHVVFLAGHGQFVMHL